MAELIEENTGAGFSDKEQRMMTVLNKWDDAFFNQDAQALKALLAEDVVQHPDHIVTETDRRGPEQVARFHAKFFENYKTKHLPVVHAVNEKTNSAYCLWDDEDVIMKPERFDESLPASGSVTSLSGIWRLVMDGEMRIKDIWFLRQLTREEKKHRLKHRPNQLYSDFHAKSLVGPKLELSGKQVEKMHAAAEAFNQAWSTGDVKSVHEIMSAEAHTVNPIFGEKKGSRQEWEEMVNDVFKVWEVKSNEVDIAVTPSSNKAFIWWHVRGVQKDTQQDQVMYGLNLLVFDPKEGLITEVVGFRQPLQSEHAHIFKAGSYLEMKDTKQGEAAGAAGGGEGTSSGQADADTQTAGGEVGKAGPKEAGVQTETVA